MTCGRCGGVCSDAARFCGACGAPLNWNCSGCGAPNPGKNRFCESCGAPRAGSASSPAVPDGVAGPTDRLRAEGERRHLTVMFCDLVGSTTLSGELDPEEMQRVVLIYQHACTSAIESNGGYVAHFMGDGILAYFGYPVASDHAAMHAVRAGRAVIDAVQRCQHEVPGLAVRVGIHSGLSVVADMGAGQQRQLRDVVGETPNVAARVQSMAAPGTVVISAETAVMCEGFFDLLDLGPHELKGVARPMTLFEVQGDSGATSRLDVAQARNRLSPLVGRRGELDLLLDAWQRTLGGDGQVVWVSGEPGIGKSRLIRELLDRVHDTGGIEIELRCSQFHQSTSLYSSAEQFRRFVINLGGDFGIEALERLADENGTPRGLVVPVVADLLGIPLVAPYQRIVGSADRMRQHTLDVVSRLIDDRAQRQPVVLVVDDAQWMDATTAEMLARYIGSTQRKDLMTVVTHRNDYFPDVPGAEHHRQLHLDGLPLGDIEALIRALAGNQGIDEHMVRSIVERTEGVPLFVEELTDLVLRLGDDTALVPVTLRDSLMARLDLLGPEAALLRTLSVLGREATESLLADVSGLDRASFLEYAQRLIDAGLVFRRGRGVHAVYAFKHALQQDVVYESMLRSTRRLVHARVAESLEDRFVERITGEPEMAARHCELAGDPARAVSYLLRAGDRAIAISAHAEAMHHLRHAQQLISLIPDTSERDIAEIKVLVKLGVPVTAVHGYGSTEAEDVYERAQVLCAEVGDDSLAFSALYGLFRNRLLRADYRRAGEIARTLATLAGAEPHRRALTVGAHRALGSVLLYQGDDVAGALAHFDAASSGADAQLPGSFLGDLNDVVDPVVTSRSYSAWSHWLLGDTVAARRASGQAIDMARRLGHPFTLNLALCFDTWLCQFTGDVAATAARAEEAHRQSIEHGFPFWTGWAQVLWSWADSRRDPTSALTSMRDGMVQWQGQGSQLGTTYFLALIAEVEASVESAESGEAAESTLSSAIELAEGWGERFWLPELLRQRADLLRRQGGPPATWQHWVQEARSLAMSQGAVALARRIDETFPPT